MTERDWPDWLEALRPDSVTRERMRRAIVREAVPLLTARRAGWFDVASRWATLLSPVAAAITLLFAGLAVLQTPVRDAPSDQLAEAPPSVDQLLESSGPAVPAAFAHDSLADLDIVLTAIASED